MVAVKKFKDSEGKSENWLSSDPLNTADLENYVFLLNFGNTIGFSDSQAERHIYWIPCILELIAMICDLHDRNDILCENVLPQNKWVFSAVVVLRGICWSFSLLTLHSMPCNFIHISNDN